MKGSILWKLMYLFCALAGVLAGYGVFVLTGAGEHKPNISTKDNTLVRESGDGVFFDAEEMPEPLITNVPENVTVPPSPTPIPAELLKPTPTPTPSVMAAPEVQQLEQKELPEPSIIPEPEVGHAALTPEPESMPSLSGQWMDAGQVVMPTPVAVTPTPAPVAEAFTYPAEIFGQVPVINRSDSYVSYFEFAYDLIVMLEPEVKARGLNMNSLLTKFAIKALFCGVDIEKLDINAPIPRRLAALCLWLAARILEESGVDTSAKSAQQYVTDIGGCSSAEKKAVAYLYEMGIIKGYQITGQKFYPDAGLTTKSGAAWLSGIKQCWK